MDTLLNEALAILLEADDNPAVVAFNAFKKIKAKTPSGQSGEGFWFAFSGNILPKKNLVLVLMDGDKATDGWIRYNYGKGRTRPFAYKAGTPLNGHQVFETAEEAVQSLADALKIKIDDSTKKSLASEIKEAM